MPQEMHCGSCLCGTVAYRVEGPIEAFFLCHCSRCRKASGSAHAATLFAPGATLTWTAGAENVHRFHLEGTRHARSFCRTCGSPVPMVLESEGIVMVPAGSLDTELHLRPDAHICDADRAPWDTALETVARMDGLPG